MPITDAFTGTDGTGLTSYSASWVYTRGSGANLQLSSNTLAVDSVGPVEAMAERVGSFAASHYAQVALVATPAANGAAGPAVRCQGAGAQDGYGAYGTTSASELFRLDNGGFTLLSSAAGFANADVIKLDASGTTLTTTKNGSTTGAPAATSDATYPGGAPGVVGFNNTGTTANVRIDAFESTDAAAALAASIAARAAVSAAAVDSPPIPASALYDTRSWFGPTAALKVSSWFADEVSDTVAAATLKYWSGSAWLNKPLKQFNGSAWAVKPAKVRAGSTWRAVQ